MRAELDEDPGGQPARDCAQFGIGRLTQIGQQRRRGIRVGGQQGRQRIGIELADLWGNGREIGVSAGELGAADGAPGRALVPVPAQAGP